MTRLKLFFVYTNPLLDVWPQAHHRDAPWLQVLLHSDNTGRSVQQKRKKSSFQVFSILLRVDRF